MNTTFCRRCQNWLRRLWQVPTSRWSLGLPVGAWLFALLGLLFWGGFNTAIEATNSMTFCISCHEMRDTVYQEYLNSPHYRNTAGVRAICSDCHVPRSYGAKLWRKIQASNEIFHKLAGTVDTPEKFEQHRAEMAERVWASMKQTDSRECRNCHAYDSMALEEQDKRAARKHAPEWRQEHGDTCIDCHKGIAHQLPQVD